MSHQGSAGSAVPEFAHPRFAALYNWLVGWSLDPVRRMVVGQAYGVVLEVGAGGGQNSPLHDPARVTRIEAVEPDEAMLVAARCSLAVAPVPIRGCLLSFLIGRHIFIAVRSLRITWFVCLL